MQKINVSESKAVCLRLFDRVRETGEPLEILKNGKPLAVVLPPTTKQSKGGFGSMKTKVFSGPLGDVMEPVGELKWEVLRKK